MALHPSMRCFLPFILFLLLQPSSLTGSDALTFNFSSFDSSDSAYVDTGSSGAINSGALQLTFDSASNTTKIRNSSGRITYDTPLRFSHPRFNYTASFNTSFILNMAIIPSDDGVNRTTGGGMAFILCSEPASESEITNSAGAYLGLFNGSASNNSINTRHRLLAIEFDTFKDSYDPDDNHVGIDLNSTVSVANISLTPLGITLRNDKGNTSVWIDYDGLSTTLIVFVAAGTNVRKPAEPVLSYSIDLRQYFPENVYLGFSGSTGDQVETHCVVAWSFVSVGFPSSKKTGLIVGVILAGSALVLLGLAFCYAVVRRRSRKSGPVEWDPNDPAYGPRNFTYKELSKATKKFSADSVLGKGGFGAVFKGTLTGPINSTVAVKRISTPCKSKEGMRQFIAEVTIMGRLRHRNLVQLLGWCQDRQGQLLLVYEYMTSGDLNQWLHGVEGKGPEAELDWEKRYKVMKGLATGLLYLHEEGEKVIVHRDLKPSNVLLDGEFNAKLGDFGLARLIESDDQWTETNTIAGTIGYIAPECLDTGIITRESDLYSFGTVGMEVATGCRPSSDLRQRLWQFYEENRLCDAADSRLTTFQPAEMERLLLVSLACCNPAPALRPDIRQVLHALSSLSSPLVVHPPPAITLHDSSFIEFPSASSSATAGFGSVSDPSSR